MSSILESPDVLAALRQRKRQTEKKLEASRQRMQATVSQFYAPASQATSRAQSISRFVSNGIVIYRGIRLFSNILSTFSTLLPRRKRRR